MTIWSASNAVRCLSFLTLALRKGKTRSQQNQIFRIDDHSLYLYGVCGGMKKNGKCSKKSVYSVQLPFYSRYQQKQLQLLQKYQALTIDLTTSLFQHFLGMSTSLFSNFDATHHARNFFHSLILF